MQKALQVEALVKTYGKGCPRCLERTGATAGTNTCVCGTVVALNQVSLTLLQGEILAIMGESGSGKSTLLRTLFLQDKPDQGRAFFWNQEQKVDLFDLNPSQARFFRDHYFGIVCQNPHEGLNFDISAGGNIAERVLIAGRKHYAKVRERASRLLEQTQVPTNRMDQSPRGFSGGMQQRLQIAKALATEPALLLLDEVTSNLDLSVQARVLDLILDLHQELKLSVIVVTHDLGVAKLLASRTMIMRYGRIIESGLTDQILEDPQQPYTQELIGAAL